MRRGNGDGRRGKPVGSTGSPSDGKPLVKRRVGAARGRRKGCDEGGAGAEIVVLTWAQTFGRTTASPRPGAVRSEGDDGSGRIVVLGEGKPGS